MDRKIEKTKRSKKLHSGERQTGVNLKDIEETHLKRYFWALRGITSTDKVLDAGCGIGYGSWISSIVAKKVVGIDDSQEAIEFAKKEYQRANIEYRKIDILGIDEEEKFNVILAFEVIEHIEDTEKIIKKLTSLVEEKIILSVPHKSVPVEKYPFHHRHFGENELATMFKKKGMEKIHSFVYLDRGNKNIYMRLRRK